MGPLWKCPRCGAKLVSRGLSHACGDYSVAQFLKEASPHAQHLFGRFVELIRACGPYEVAPSKTRVAFMASVRFASVNRVSPTHIDVHFVLPRPLSSPRFRRVEKPHVGGGGWPSASAEAVKSTHRLDVELPGGPCARPPS